MSHGHDVVLNEDQGVSAGRPGPLHRFTDLSVRYVEKWMPDPYLFAVILTLLVVGLIFAFVPGASLGGVVDGWYKGVWGEGNIFTFAMQMILILVGGYTLAEAPIVKRGLQWLASKPKNQAQGGLLCFGVAALACLVNWGLGLVVGPCWRARCSRGCGRSTSPIWSQPGTWATWCGPGASPAPSPLPTPTS